MEYEPIKHFLSTIIQKKCLYRKVFYKLLGLLFLREWYVKKAIRGMKFKREASIRILDAGAGFGQYSYYCIKKYPSAFVLGLEINPAHIKAGNQFFQSASLDNVTFRTADITQMAYKNEFDMILSIDTMEHIEQDELVFQNFSRALKPGGRLIISTPSLYRKHKQDGAFVGEHFREGYTVPDLRQKLDRADLEIEKLTRTYGFWGDLSWRMGIRNTIKIMDHSFIGKIAGPLYLLLLFPVIWIFMVLDYVWVNRRGTGLVCVAAKGHS